MSTRIARFVVLLVLDGWGVAKPSQGNAITQANPLNFNKFWASYPHTTLSASGEAVGLPRGEPGNTETGHLNLGAGRIVYQDLPRINLSIADGSFFKNETFLGAIEHAKKNNSKLHIMGLVGAGGVHSNPDHLYALIRMTHEQKFTNLFIHVFTDGRDSPPESSQTYIKKLEEIIANEGTGKIATVMGRYWALDRDYRWERTQKAYLALTSGVGQKALNALSAVEASYKNGKTDEFIEPTVITDASGLPVAKVEENDAVIFFNFRIDRPRQLSKAFVLENFEEVAQKEWDFDPYMVKYYKKHIIDLPARPVFKRGPKIPNIYFVTMTQYSKSIDAHIAFPPQVVTLPLGRILSEQGMLQLKASESEKERFVSFYFNGQQDIPFEGEERLIIPSPNVATYDIKPEMSAIELTNAVLENLKLNPDTFGFALVNFANADMVGHTGNIQAAISACQTVDQCIGKIVETVENLDGVVLITGDHGNAEEMINSDGQPNTEHSTNPVPFIVVGRQFVGQNRNLLSGILADVAPTVLYLLGINKPPEMSGRNLLV